MSAISKAIAQLNDRFRQTLGFPVLSSGIPGRVVLSSGVSALPIAEQQALLQAVQAFSAFTLDNDPYGEHDLGRIDLPGVGTFFWKIDYYDSTYTYGSPDPADLAQTRRVLTVMFTEEY